MPNIDRDYLLTRRLCIFPLLAVRRVEYSDPFKQWIRAPVSSKARSSNLSFQISQQYPNKPLYQTSFQSSCHPHNSLTEYKAIIPLLVIAIVKKLFHDLIWFTLESAFADQSGSSEFDINCKNNISEKVVGSVPVPKLRNQKFYRKFLCSFWSKIQPLKLHRTVTNV